MGWTNAVSLLSQITVDKKYWYHPKWYVIEIPSTFVTNAGSNAHHASRSCYHPWNGAAIIGKPDLLNNPRDRINSMWLGQLMFWFVMRSSTLILFSVVSQCLSYSPCALHKCFFFLSTHIKIVFYKNFTRTEFLLK